MKDSQVSLSIITVVFNGKNSIEKTIAVPKLKVEELFSIETDDYFPILLEVLLGKNEEAKAEPTAAVEEATVVPMN